MELNKEKLDKMSISDIISVGELMDKNGGKKDENVNKLLTFFKSELARRMAELCEPSEPFDFEAWLLQNGWSVFNKTTTTVYFAKQYQNEDGIETAKIGLNHCYIVTCSRRDIYLFGKCKKPSSIQEAETLFKLFNL